MQTTTFCNSKCIICPHKDIHGEKDVNVMSDDLFLKIITEISNHQPSKIIPYLNSEPFGDQSYLQRLQIIHEFCPKAAIEISTNLSLINEKIIQGLKPFYIDDFRVSFFGFSRKTYERMMPGLNWNIIYPKLIKLAEDHKKDHLFGKLSLIMIQHEYVPEEEYEQALRFCVKNEIGFERWGFLDRAGNVENFQNQIPIQVDHCYCRQNRPYERIHILWDGSVIQCCQDWKSENVLGNIASQSIEEIWNSNAYIDFRNRVSSNNVNSPKLCKKCKIFYL